MKKYLAGLLLLGACETQPTKVFESSKPLIPKAVVYELSISEKTVLLDSRSVFLFNLSHMPGAINLSWDEFTDSGAKTKGRLVKDLYHSARRLARLGVGPESSIVVIGEGRDGKGEEGRLAWTLRYLGVTDVHFASKDYFDQTKWIHVKAAEIALPSIPSWKPKLNKAIIVEKEEIQRLRLAGPNTSAKSLVVDVRDSQEFLKSLPSVVNPNIRVINIEWKEFIDEKGRPNIEVARKLRGVNIGNEMRVVVIGETGVESGLVVEALLALGFSNAAHFPGGMRELSGSK
ncbi:MAG: rhodanese-like domain-containing protein [Pseudomonadota bacterium]|nr:rhodanese-like domain-containing protein [Pseudomonadota bacterium]